MHGIYYRVSYNVEIFQASKLRPSYSVLGKEIFLFFRTGKVPVLVSQSSMVLSIAGAKS